MQLKAGRKLSKILERDISHIELFSRLSFRYSTRDIHLLNNASKFLLSSKVCDSKFFGVVAGRRLGRYGSKKNSRYHVIKPQYTIQSIIYSFGFIKKAIQENNRENKPQILFVNSSPILSNYIQLIANQTSQMCVYQIWPQGLLTNFSGLASSLKNYGKIQFQNSQDVNKSII